MLNMNNDQDVMKLQRLQNRALRMCFDIIKKKIIVFTSQCTSRSSSVVVSFIDIL